MVKKAQGLYACESCGLHYKEKEWADKCEAWCKKYNSCNLEYIRHSVEGGKK